MKKFLKLILIFLTFFAVNVKAEKLPTKTEHEKVKVYIFKGDGCGFCAKAIEWFGNLDKKYDDYFEVVSYEVWNDKKNARLAEKVALEMGTKLDGVPFIVIGKEKYVSGFTEDVGKELVSYALKEYQNEEYVDLVQEVAKKLKLDEEESSDTGTVVAIMLGFSVVFIGYILLARKHN